MDTTEEVWDAEDFLQSRLVLAADNPMLKLEIELVGKLVGNFRAALGRVLRDKPVPRVDSLCDQVLGTAMAGLFEQSKKRQKKVRG